MHEGRKRQIREVGSRIGLPVQRIIRVRIGTLLLGNLKPREWRNLTRDEVKRLKSLSMASKQTKGSKPGPAKKVGVRRHPELLGERRLK
jgi:23S rRNA pseudouridine2605 synthase